MSVLDPIESNLPELLRASGSQHDVILGVTSNEGAPLVHNCMYIIMHLYLYIMMCQAHPLLVKKGESNVRFVSF